MNRNLVSIALAGGLLLAGITGIFIAHPRPVQAQQGCAVDTLRGTYGVHIQGWFPADDKAKVPTLPFAQAGLGVADGAGNIDIVVSTSMSGEILKSIRMAMKYEVNADCTGSMTPVPGSNAGPVDFVVVDGGKQIFIVGTSPGAVLSGVGVRY